MGNMCIPFPGGKIEKRQKAWGKDPWPVTSVVVGYSLFQMFQIQIHFRFLADGVDLYVLNWHLEQHDT